MLGVCTACELQALVYDILPWRKVPESGARSVHCMMSVFCKCVFLNNKFDRVKNSVMPSATTIVTKENEALTNPHIRTYVV